MDRNERNTPVDERSNHTESNSHVANWNSHEHQTDPARMHAQQLVQETGSSELAKHIIDEVAHEGQADPHRASFARGFGFESYLAMF